MTWWESLVVPAVPVVVKGGGRVLECSAVGLDIPIGVAELVVPEITGEQHEMMRKWRRLPAPLSDPIGRKGMPEIVQSDRLHGARRHDGRREESEIILNRCPSCPSARWTPRGVGNNTQSLPANSY